MKVSHSSKYKNKTYYTSTFRRLGNLALYDGWSPDYFYFKSLIGLEDTKHYSESYNAAIANAMSKKAAQAVADAKSHNDTIYGKNENRDPLEVFSQKIQMILEFLWRAQKLEATNEVKFLIKKINDIEEAFDPKIRKKIPSLKRLRQDLMDFIDNKINPSGTMSPENNAQDFYIRLTTAFNIAIQGFETTQYTFKTESERLKEIEDLAKTIIQGRGNQGAALSMLSGGDLEQQEQSRIRSQERLKRQWYNFYQENGNLTKVKTKKVIERKYIDGKIRKQEVQKVIRAYGGQKFRDIDSTIDNQLKDWLNNIVTRLFTRPQVVSKLKHYIRPTYNQTGDFLELDPSIREEIIHIIMEYCTRNMPSILDQRMTKKNTDAIIDNMMDGIEKDINHKLYYLESFHDIQGLNPYFGLKGKPLKLFQETQDKKEMQFRSSEELYNSMERVISKAEKEGFGKLTKGEQVLLQFYDEKSNHKLQDLKDIIHEIQEIKKVEDKLNEINKQLKKSEEKSDKELEKQTRQQKIYFNNNGKKVGIKIIYDGKTASVDMAQFKQIIRDLPEVAQLGFKEFNPRSITTAISSIKNKLSQNIRDQIAAQFKNEQVLEEIGLTKKTLEGYVRQALENLEVSFNGPQVSEILPGIQLSQIGNSMVIDWNGPKSMKNDFAVIEVRTSGTIEELYKLIKNDERTKARLKKRGIDYEKVYTTLTDARKQFLSEYETVINDFNVQLMRRRDPELYSKMAQVFELPKDIQHSNLPDKLKKAHKKFITTITRFQDMLETANIEEEKVNKAIKELRSTLKNSIYTSGTVKTYNNYINDFGFLGGSLGQGMVEQLDRLQDLLSSAGAPMSTEDRAWLESAILNCSPASVVGESNKKMIEGYLGSVAAFALFSEGGVEINLINTINNDVKKSSSSSAPSIMHLYRLNGMLVPGSYILGQTISTIKNEILPTISKIDYIQNKGAGISIVNKANESMIPNRPLSDYYDSYDANAWATTGQAVKKSISLNILFLAGFLDLVNSLNDSMQDIKIPE